MKPVSNLAPPKDLDEANEQIRELAARNEELVALVNDLKAQVEALSDRLGKNSRNSSRPPSTDSESQRKKRRRNKPTGRNKGAQPGHDKYSRALWPHSEVNETHHYYPNTRCVCGGSITVDPDPCYRHQVFDLPAVTYHVTEHQVFSGRCEWCHRRREGRWPDWVPNGQMGPGLISWIALMSGQFHLSIRKIQQLLSEQWELDFSLGAISQAQGKANQWLSVHYKDIADHVRASQIAHADETTHWSMGDRAWLWVLSSSTAVLFITHYSRGKKAAAQLLGQFSGYLVTDQYVGYDNFNTFKRQLCWSHLIRKFIAMSERRGNGGKIGKRLLLYARAVIRTRHRFDKKQITEATYFRRMNRLQWYFEEYLEKGTRLRIDTRTANQCRYLLPDVHMCWTFLSDHQIPLTNNLAERALRPYVIWRKLSYSTQSAAGNQFRPMILSVIQTLKLQGRPTYDFLRQSCTESMRDGKVSTRFDFQEKTLLKAT